MSNNIESAPLPSPRRWPWLLLAAVILGFVLAILWMIAEVKRVKTFEHMDFRPPATNRPPTQ